jgi:hypothetical protein
MAKKKLNKAAKVAKKVAVKKVAAKVSKPRETAAKPSAAAKGKQHTIYHKDGSIYGTGQMLDGKMHGYWEFFRKNGTIMRSGTLDREQQIGTWTTYDASGKPYKVTEMKTGAKAKPTAKSGASKAKPTKAIAKPPARKSAKKPKLLSGGNPQIAKGDGDAPVQAYIAAMPGWKQDVGRRLDTLITRTVPDVRKAVKWNTPFFGADGAEDKPGWFLAFHCATKYVKVAFFHGTSLRPAPPVESTQKEVRYFHIHEEDQLDEAQFARWVKEASQLPGKRM